MHGTWGDDDRNDTGDKGPISNKEEGRDDGPCRPGENVDCLSGTPGMHSLGCAAMYMPRTLNPFEHRAERRRRDLSWGYQLQAVAVLLTTWLTPVERIAAATAQDPKERVHFGDQCMTL